MFLVKVEKNVLEAMEINKFDRGVSVDLLNDQFHLNRSPLLYLV